MAQATHHPEDVIIGNNLRSYRKQMGLTQQAFAEYLSITREEVSYYETGARRFPSQLFEKAANLFGIDEYDLYEEDPTVRQMQLATALRSEGLTAADLDVIASFRKIALNYLKMKTKLQYE